jgi:inorganic pyrophosphatase
MSGISALKPFDDETKDLNVIIESPKGCRNKYTFDAQKDLLFLAESFRSEQYFLLTSVSSRYDRWRR